MNGQWIGRYEGSNSGLLVLDLDEMKTHYEGIVCAYDDNSSLPGTFAAIKTNDSCPLYRGQVQLAPIDWRTGVPTSREKVSTEYPDVRMPQVADLELRLNGDILHVSWKTDIETVGSAVILRSQAGLPSEYQPLQHVRNWHDFKSYISTLEHRRYIFRGQSTPLRLRTSFHRTGRANLPRFLEEDIKALHRHLSQRTTHVFNLSVPEENGAFFNLVQHHGYPTPLLDWTFSPYVATFFAYHRVRNSDARAAPDKKVRIFIFDQRSWREKFAQLVHLTWRKPHFSIMEFIAIGNERLVPQQSISSITNVDDIESYIRLNETDEQTYLKIIDLPVCERPDVMRELSVMGITAGSLFPGLDGSCEELRERFFDL